MAEEAVVPNKYGSLFFIKILKPPPKPSLGAVLFLGDPGHAYPQG